MYIICLDVPGLDLVMARGGTWCAARVVLLNVKGSHNGNYRQGYGWCVANAERKCVYSGPGPGRISFPTDLHIPDAACYWHGWRTI